uniref:Odorant-binding protein n=1 Tax=Delia antiqua TaxID=265456 RepID=S6B1X7_9MUSC|nr:odorant-binding protein [Delia antiqua]
MLKFLPIFIVAFVAVKAYDFTDFDFNQYLFDEFVSMNDDDSVSRQRRDTEVIPAGEKKECGGRRGDWKKDFACCAGDKFDPEHFKMIKETKKQCAAKLRANNSDVENFDPFDCEKMGRIKQLIICEGECFSKAMNILDESGKLNREVIVKHLSEHWVNDSEWKKAAYEGYVDKCIAKAESIEQHADQKCNSVPMEFHYCIWGQFINGCPADLRVESSKCNKMRERHIQGTGSFLNKHVLHDFLHHGHGKTLGSEEKDM